MEKNKISITELIGKTPLYKKIKVTVEDYLTLEGLAFTSNNTMQATKIEGYCSSCGENSLFFREPTETEFMENQRIYKTRSEPKHTDDDDAKKTRYLSFFSDHKIINMLFKCGKNEKHKMQVSFILDKDIDTIIKFGQYPSSIDFNRDESFEYKKEIAEYEDEYKKASILYAQGYACGSFLYLRRIFEKIIYKKYEEVKNDEKWGGEKKNKFIRSKTKEKIEMLKEYLSDFLLDNKSNLYNILSAGVHELTEEECYNYFQVLKTTILLILQEEHEIKNRNKLKEEMNASLNKIVPKSKK